MSRNLFCWYKSLNLEFTLFRTIVTIDSSESVSSRKQPIYVTFEYCLFLYWIFKGLALLILHFLLKRIDLVLSSQKWMLSLLNCKVSVVENSNHHYNHKFIKLFEHSFTGVCLNFNIKPWFLQSYQNSNF